jgi:hypothetical protein
MRWRAWITYNIRCGELFLLQFRVKVKLHVMAFPLENKIKLHM